MWVVVDNRDLFAVALGGVWFFTIRWYKESAWGKRWMGKGRIAFDCGRISFLLENYG